MSCHDHDCSVCRACAKELLAVGARSERRRIAGGQRRAIAEPMTWTAPGTLQRETVLEIGAATRAPKPKRAVRPVTTKEGG